VFEVMLDLLAEAADERVGVADDDQLPAAEHRKAAELVEHVGKVSLITVEVDPLEVGWEAGEDRRKFLGLQIGVRPDQRIDGLGFRR
jgi:hypothetical protein